MFSFLHSQEANVVIISNVTSGALIRSNLYKSHTLAGVPRIMQRNFISLFFASVQLQNKNVFLVVTSSDCDLNALPVSEHVVSADTPYWSSTRML